ncbi:MAG TPA: M28 family peptidase [Bacteroidia bacterium]|jgi:aminopeptidase YwaD|nr:M28 family peptidase [Bacteroidia bacterium]
MKKIVFISFLILNSSFLISQDSLYARLVIKKLTSKEFYGRGYLNNGLDEAAKFISAELKRFKAEPLFTTGYFQWFDFDVNTFPNKINVKLNGKLLKPGIDFIPTPESSSIKGKYKLAKKDSVNYLAENSPLPLVVSLKRKLTFSVATNSASYCAIEILNMNQYKDLKTIDLNIESKVLTKYINKNICAFTKGTENNDTVIMFTAHYDHLGGIGKKTFFPGANDNASGVSMVLNLIKYYSQNPPKYKMVFVFFAGEEAGLIGSKYFVDNNTVDLTKIKFLINLDLLGTGIDGIMVVNSTEFKPQFEKLKKVNDEQGLVKEIKQRGKAHNSDHYWFSEKGVPCFFIYTLGGIKAYHDVFDIEKTLPLTGYSNVFKLLTGFVKVL